MHTLLEKILLMIYVPMMTTTSIYFLMGIILEDGV